MGTVQKCWSAPGAPTIQAILCKIRVCTDNTTSTTNSDCEAFLPGCKTSGAGCVVNAAVCYTFLGNSSTCSSYYGADGTSFCRAGVSVPKICNDAICSDNATSTTDVECNSFMTGCVTKGLGCIPSTEPCTKYQGVQSTCDKFTGNGKRCWNPSSVTITSTYCVEKKCSDDNVSTTDAACNSSLTDCVTKGTGCIEKTAACESFSGTQATCSTFKGNSGSKPCWNVATATLTTPCLQKACINNTMATSDSECESFFPRLSGATVP